MSVAVVGDRVGDGIGIVGVGIDVRIVPVADEVVSGDDLGRGEGRRSGHARSAEGGMVDVDAGVDDPDFHPFARKAQLFVGVGDAGHRTGPSHLRENLGLLVLRHCDAENGEDGFDVRGLDDFFEPRLIGFDNHAVPQARMLLGHLHSRRNVRAESLLLGRDRLRRPSRYRRLRCQLHEPFSGESRRAFRFLLEAVRVQRRGRSFGGIGMNRRGDDADCDPDGAEKRKRASAPMRVFHGYFPSFSGPVGESVYPESIICAIGSGING